MQTSEAGGTIAGTGDGAVGAFFDMDYTILRGSSGSLYLRYLRRSGHLSLLSWVHISWLVGLYASKLLDFPELMGRLTARVANQGEDEAWRLSADWFATMLRDYIADRARSQVAWHLAQGHHVALVSAATPYAVAPVAADLGLGERYLCTRLELAHGCFTGRVVLPPCYGTGKVTHVQEYADRHSIDLVRSFFYSDSHHDRPLLDAVGHPVAVNPDSLLKRHAETCGWKIVYFY